jgi:hypothetical protein
MVKRVTGYKLQGKKGYWLLVAGFKVTFACGAGEFACGAGEFARLSADSVQGKKKAWGMGHGAWSVGKGKNSNR